MPLSQRTSIRTLAITSSLITLLAAPALLAGDLTPPPGAVAPTMLPLDHAEPSAPITMADLPLTITTPGAYHLVENLPARSGSAGTDCITIDAPNVTLDLRGFHISGAAAIRWDNAIELTASAKQCVIRNGVLTGSMGNGLNASAAAGVTVDRIQSIANLQSGIQLGAGAHVIDTVCADNASRGISAGLGSTFTRVTSRGNASTGVFVSASSVVTQCVSQGNQTGFIVGSGATITDSAATQNTTHGFSLSGAIASRCAATANTLDGFNANDSLLTDCIARTNSQHGFSLYRSAAQGCMSSGNTFYGMHANDATLRNNSSFTNGASGILVETGANSLIDGNHCAGNAGPAITSFIAPAWIVRNAAGYNETFIFIVGQADGGITNNPETAGPWANFLNSSR